MKVKRLEVFSRFDLPGLLGDNSDCIGIELGVAAGDYSARMVASGKFAQYFGVDMYADTHDVEQYKTALKKVGILEDFKLLRMTFDEALSLFPDNFFDFMYLDGYAGTGMEGGRTLRQWAPKIKIGGILAGDDYHEDFPIIQNVVNEVCTQNNFELMITDGAFDNSAYSQYPSWAVIKTAELQGATSPETLEAGRLKYIQTRKKKLRAKKLDDLLKSVISENSYGKIQAWNRKRRENRNVQKRN